MGKANSNTPENDKSASEKNKSNKMKWKADASTKVLLSFIVFYICFHTYFEELFINSSIPIFFEQFNDNLLTKILFLVAVFWLLCDIWLKCKRRVVLSWFNIWTGLILVGFWGYYRCYYNLIGYDYIDAIFHFKYVDILVVLGIKPALIKLCPNSLIKWFIKQFNRLKSFIQLLFAKCVKYIQKHVFPIKEHTKEEEKQASQETAGFYRDDPIESLKDDTLGRSKGAISLVDKIRNTSVDTSAFSVGIVSPWGYGKTSFFFCMKEHLEKEEKDALVIDFNPWRYDKNVNRTEAFFNQLVENLKPYYRDLGCDLIQYSKLLNNSGLPALQLIFNFFNRDVNRLFDEIGRKLKKIDRKIFIFIDDLDRMDGDEIAEILKLIRNSANFPKLYFIAAYDRKYLNIALKNINTLGSSLYLEKIFQVEYQLPPIDSKKLKEELEKSCAEVFKTKGDEIEKDKKNFERLLNFEKPYDDQRCIGFIFHLIQNMRDVRRYASLFTASYKALQGNIVVKDLMNITLLQLKYPSIYELFSERKDAFLMTTDSRVDLYPQPEEKIEESSLKKQSKYDETYKMNFSKYLSDNEIHLGLNELDVTSIEMIFKALFPENSGGDPTNEAINHINSTERYFHYSLLETDLNVIEFNDLWKDDFNQIKKEQISSINKSNKLRSLVSQMKSKVTVFQKEESEKFINMMFYLGEIKFDMVLYNDIKRELDKYSHVDKTNDFLLKILPEQNWNKFTAYFLARYIGDLSYKQETETPNDVDGIIEKLFKVQNELFKKYTQLEPPVKDVWNYTVNIPPSHDIKDYPASPLIKKTLIDYVSNHPEEFLSCIISYEKIANEDRKYSVDSDVRKIWGEDSSSWAKFDKYINSVSHNTPIIGEFKQFWSAFRNANYPEEGISFKFEKMQ